MAEIMAQLTVPVHTDHLLQDGGAPLPVDGVAGGPLTDPGRLPSEKKYPTGALPTAAVNRLAEMETLIEDREQKRPSSYRKSSLREIHEETVQLFVNQPAFGVKLIAYLSEYLPHPRGPPNVSPAMKANAEICWAPSLTE